MLWGYIIRSRIYILKKRGNVKLWALYSGGGAMMILIIIVKVALGCLPLVQLCPIVSRQGLSLCPDRTVFSPFFIFSTTFSCHHNIVSLSVIVPYVPF